MENNEDYNHYSSRSAQYRKRTRTVMNRAQNEILTAVFNKDPFPSTEVRENLARSLRIKPRTVQIWFQNQRQKAKNKDDVRIYIGKIDEPMYYTIPNRIPKKTPLEILADIASDEFKKCLEKSEENESKVLMD